MQIEGACHCGLISFTAEFDWPSARIWKRSAMPWLTNLNRVDSSQEGQAFIPAEPRRD